MINFKYQILPGTKVDPVKVKELELFFVETDSFSNAFNGVRLLYDDDYILKRILVPFATGPKTDFFLFDTFAEKLSTAITCGFVDLFLYSNAPEDICGFRVSKLDVTILEIIWVPKLKRD